MAHSLAKAQTLIDAMKFAVAFVDIGLDIDDDRNIDGLRVMEKIRSVGDETSIIVVTGRSGRDVLPITRDAIKKYDAFDAVGKVPIEPSDIRRLVRGGLEAYAQVSSTMRTRVNDVLRGDVPGLEWDDRMLNAIKIAGGASGLYKFLDSLVKNFLPLVPRTTVNTWHSTPPPGSPVARTGVGPLVTPWRFVSAEKSTWTGCSRKLDPPATCSANTRSDLSSRSRRWVR